MRLVGYGGMIIESVVAVMALITASILGKHLYITLNAPVAQTGGTATTAAAYVNHLGLSGASITAEQITPPRPVSASSRSCRTPAARRRWRPGVWVCSLTVVAAWGSILLIGLTDPLGGINTLFRCAAKHTGKTVFGSAQTPTNSTR